VRNIFSICSSLIGEIAASGEALPHPARHDLETGPVQGARHRGQLGDHLRAVPPGLDHRDDPGQLALRAAQPVQYRACGLLVDLHQAVLSSGDRQYTL